MPQNPIELCIDNVCWEKALINNDIVLAPAHIRPPGDGAPPRETAPHPPPGPETILFKLNPLNGNLGHPKLFGSQPEKLPIPGLLLVGGASTSRI